LRGQVPGKAVEHLGGAFLAQRRCLRAADAVQVGACSVQVRAVPSPLLANSMVATDTEILPRLSV